MINSLSIGKFIWGEIEDGRFSFRYTDLPDDIHFTLSWKNSNNINLHLTRNTADASNKPKIRIMKWDKALADQFMPFIPQLVMKHLFTAISFSNYSRSARKNIRILYFDELEKSGRFENLQEKATALLKPYSTIKRKKKLRINPAAEKAFDSFFSSPEVLSLFMNNLRSLRKNAFNSAVSRCSIIFMGNKKHHFVTFNNKCYLLNKRKSLAEFLTIFFKPELVEGLTKKITEAILQLQQAKIDADVQHLDNPYQLYLEA